MASLNVVGHAAGAVFFVVLLSPAFASDGDVPDELIIPPGQDQLLAEMLGWGRMLPGECRFTGGLADGPIAQGRYSCPAGEVILELTHSSQAVAGAMLTGNFAVTLQSGSPPFGLAEAVGTLVSSREDEFEWKWREADDSDGADDGGEADEQPPPDDSDR